MATRNDDPRSFLLDGPSQGWIKGDSSPDVGADLVALRLAGDPLGSLGLDSRDGSLGRLVLPRWIAVDHQLRVYLLDPKQAVVRRFDPEAQGDQLFQPLPEVGGCHNPAPEECGLGLVRPDPPRRLRTPWGIAVDRTNLYVADSGNSRVQVFSLDSFALRAIWTFAAPPCDVAVDHRTVYVLTEQRIFRYQPGDDLPTPFLDLPREMGKWKRLAVDRAGRIYALREQKGESPTLDIFSRTGQPEVPAAGENKVIHDPAQVRDRFDYPAVWAVPEETAGVPLAFVLPGELTRPCGNERPTVPKGQAEETLFGRCPPWCASPEVTPRTSNGCGQQSEQDCHASEGVVFTIEGKRLTVNACRFPTTPLFRKQGVWISAQLDSNIYRCQWHRIEAKLRDLPAGCGIHVQTYVSDQPQFPDDIRGLPESAWQEAFFVVGQARDPRELAKDPTVTLDGLVPGGPGRYLWLRVELLGAGFDTPVVESLRVHYPRQSYLEYLPAVFSQDEQSRQFLERYLSIFQTEWDSLERRVAEFAQYLDPKAVPLQGGFLEYLAGWLGVTFENQWTPEQRRLLLKHIPALTFAPRQADDPNPGHNRRGTLAGLSDFIKVYLQNITGADTAALPFPKIIEGFRERNFRFLGAEADAPLTGSATERPPALWGSEVVNRLQLDEHSRLDEARLLSAGDPNLDVFDHFAHQFRVFVPSAWVADAAAETVLRRAIDAEKPAHTSYSLHLVAPRFRIGVQSTCGIDTILGGWPTTYLPGGEDDGTLAPSRPPAGRLGYDTVLAALVETDAVRLASGVRLGVEAARL